MKYVIIIPDGMADHPQPSLKGKTPLEIARTPNMDQVALAGRVGLVETIPKDISPGSDVANLSLLGYDPHVYYSGRAPLEAASMGIELADADWAIRCNLVTVFEGQMLDFASGHIRSLEARILIDFLNRELGGKDVIFYPGVSYRHLVVIRGKDFAKLETIPPHDIIGKKFEKFLPRGRGSEFLIELMGKSAALLEDHEVNVVRRDLGENPANMIWLWGQGRKPTFPTFQEKYGIKGAAISAVDLIRGIAKYLGWDSIDVPGATGYYDTNYAGKGLAAVQALDRYDLVYVHIEAPDEASHNGHLQEKITAIENIDRHIVGPILSALEARREPYRLLVLPDHATPIDTRTHSREPVPFALCGEGVDAARKFPFTEAGACSSDLFIESGMALMDYFLKARTLSGKAENSNSET